MGGSAKCAKCKDAVDEGYEYDSKFAYGLTPTDTCGLCPDGCESCKKVGKCDKVRRPPTHPAVEQRRMACACADWPNVAQWRRALPTLHAHRHACTSPTISHPRPAPPRLQCQDNNIKTGGTCTACPKRCAKCSTTSPGKCAKCGVGTALSASGECVECSGSYCDACDATNPKVCLKCGDGSRMTADKTCQRCADATNQCRRCDGDANMCQDCQPASMFVLSPAGKCVECKTPGGYCDKCTWDKPKVCVKCMDGFVKTAAGGCKNSVVCVAACTWGAVVLTPPLPLACPAAG